MDKCKIRLSWFVLLIIENDAQRFGFVKTDDTPNKNKLLNKLIPNLLQIRKERREQTKRLLSDMQKENAEEIYEAVNQVIDLVYFRNADVRLLDSDIWILPTRQSKPAFDEIVESETAITAQSISEYIRGLLNEYALLPQYKREEFAFLDEIDLIQSACADGQILHFEFDGDKYKFFPFLHVYGFLYDQTNYLIGYDIIRKQIRSLPITRIETLYCLKSKFRPSDDLVSKLQDYLNEYNYSTENIMDLGEDYEDRKQKS